jgi:hypothetical protein
MHCLAPTAWRGTFVARGGRRYRVDACQAHHGSLTAAERCKNGCNRPEPDPEGLDLPLTRRRTDVQPVRLRIIAAGQVRCSCRRVPPRSVQEAARRRSTIGQNVPHLLPQDLRVDRLLAEVHTTGGGGFKLTQLFGLSDLIASANAPSPGPSTSTPRPSAPRPGRQPTVDAGHHAQCAHDRLVLDHRSKLPRRRG